MDGNLSMLDYFPFLFYCSIFDVNKKEGGFPPVLICFADPYPKCQHCSMYTLHVMNLPA